MKFAIMFLTALFSAQAFATPSIYCRTEKEEVDLTDDFYMAGDSNQRIQMVLEEQTVGGKTVLVNTDKQLLQYELSQSTGGDSSWSMSVDRVVVDGSDIQMEVVIKKDGLNYLEETLNLKVTEVGGADSDVAILNEKLAINGQNVVYQASDDDIQKIFMTFETLLKSGQLQQNDFIWMQVASCRLAQ